MELTHLPNKIFQTSPRYTLVSLIKRFGEIGIQNIHRDSEITLVEIVRDIPANLAVFPSFLYDGVEESQAKHKRRETGVRTISQHLIGYFV